MTFVKYYKTTDKLFIESHNVFCQYSIQIQIVKKNVRLVVSKLLDGVIWTDNVDMCK